MPNTAGGVTTSRMTAYRPPIAPAIAPLSVIAFSFHAMVLIPAASAAASSCLIARSDMPNRERSIQPVSPIVPIISATASNA